MAGAPRAPTQLLPPCFKPSQAQAQGTTCQQSGMCQGDSQNQPIVSADFFKILKSFTCILYVGLIVTGGNYIDRRKNVEVFPEKLDCPLPPQLPDPGELSPTQVP